MLPVTTSLLRLSLVPLEIARAYCEAFLSAASIAVPRLPGPKFDPSRGGAVGSGKVMSSGNRFPSDQSTNSAKAMSTQFYDTQVSTVNYQILFTKRDSEALLEYGITAVATAMTGSGFASWKIAEFIRNEDIKQPAAWNDEDYNEFTEVDGGKRKLKKRYLEFLQVEYQVLSSFDRKPPKYDKDGVDALQKISSTLQSWELASLPVTDPKQKGKMWNDDGTIKVSKGP